VPTALHEAVAALAASEVAAKAFGDAVHHHLVNTAFQEQRIFDNETVTDWELRRYFERG
jgi:glutamine synthetase